MGFMIVLPCDHGKHAQYYHHHELLGVYPSSSPFLSPPIMAFPPLSSVPLSSSHLATRHYAPTSTEQAVGRGSEA